MNDTPATRPAPRPAPLTPIGVDQGGETGVRRFVTVLAVTVGGLCFLFSLGNVYQLAVDLELWVWIRPLVAPAVDLSLVALVVGIRFLARRGVTGRELRRPRLFMLAVGLAAWALNTAGAVAERDWGKAAFDSLAPGLLIGWAEVLPWFLRQFHAITYPTVPAAAGAPVSVAAAPHPAGDRAVVPATADGLGRPPGVPAVPARAPSAGTGNGSRLATAGGSRPASTSGAGTAGTARAVLAPTPGGTGTGERDADAGMRAWWAAERAAGRTPSGAELDRVCGRDPKNGTGRKARARYLREEAAGRFWAPQPGPAAAPGPGGPGPVHGHGGGTGTGIGRPPQAAGLPAADPAGSPPRG
jgi:hypothetical protein